MSNADLTVDEECTGCGATPADRQAHAARSPEDDIPLGLIACPHCGASKCSMCDMGDDVLCGNCPSED